MNWVDRILIRLLLRRRQSYFRIVKLGDRNVVIDIKEYVPVKQMLNIHIKNLMEQNLNKTAQKISTRISKAIEEGMRNP